jgi:LPS-assembly protein
MRHIRPARPSACPPDRVSASLTSFPPEETGPVPTRLRPPTGSPLLALAISLAIGSVAVRAQAADTPPAQLADQASAKTLLRRSEVCPLGSFSCPRPPVSYALCRPNALLEFYQPGLPADASGRDNANTDVLAEHVDSSNPDVYRLRGNVRLQRYDELLRTDQLDYNDKTSAYDARGNVRYQDSTLLLSADRVHGTTTPDHARADNVRYQLLSSRGNGTASSAELVDPQHSQYQQATYSTCDPDRRVWEFRARSITIDKTSGFGTAHGATMRLGNVPFLYLPYFTFPIDDRRKSGFLYPTFGNSGRSGFSVAMPYYLNLAPNYDATLTPRLYSKRGAMLGTEFRYLAGFGAGQLNVDYLPNDRNAGDNRNGLPRDIEDGADRYYLRFRDVTPLGASWGFRTAVNRVSDKYYFKDFSSDLVGTSRTRLASNAYILGAGTWWNAGFGVDNYQNVDPELTDRSLPYKRWPRGTFDMDVPLARNFEFGMSSEAVAFRKDDVVEGDRLDLYPYIAAPMQGAAWFLRPQLAYRYTAYQLQRNADRYGFADRSPSRALPIASIDGGLIFERDAHLFGNSYTQTLEPRLYYLYVPYRDQSDLPIFDTRQMTFDFWQLFAPNRFSGADRQMDANNLTAAMTTRLLDEGGVERASFSFGQIRYFEPQRVQYAPGAPPTDYHGSAYVSQLSLQLSDQWRLDSSYQWDPNTRATAVGTIGVQRRLGIDGVLNFSYRYRAGFMEQFDVSTVYPLSDRWRLLGRWNVSLRDYRHWQRGSPKTLEALAGVEYEGCCLAVRLVGRHYVNDYEGHTNNAVMLEVEFKGLGSFSPQTENFLHRAILGYQ